MLAYRHPAFAVIAFLSGLLGLAAPSSVAAEPPSPPPYYAVQNVRVVSGSGGTLEGATVLLADGLIEAVGADLAVPADAWVIDGTDLVLYPGLIDGLTARGLAPAGDDAEASRGGGSPFGGGSVSRGPEDRPETTPWVSAAEELAADAFAADGTASKWRSAGFTAAVVSPEKGIFAGQAAMVALGRVERDDEAVADLVVTAPVAHRLTFETAGGFRSFPGSLMGVLAYVKQIFEDTRHALRAEAVYAADPVGRERPTFDRALASLGRALAENEPFLMPGNLPREIDRVIALARDYSLRVVLYGGQGAYARAEELAAAGIPVIVDLDWPEAEKDRDPEADTAFPTLYHRHMAPSTPARLAEAGVPFAFSSGGLVSAGEVMEAVRRAIDAGLSEERAIEALSSAAASIFGVADRVGSVEAGKIANLVLAADWPWAEEAEIAAVFVDGVRFDTRRDEEPGEPPAQDVSGTWDLVMTSPRGSQDVEAKLEMSDDGKVRGELIGRTTTAIEDGRMSGELLRFETTRQMGERSFTASWNLTVEGERLEGTMTAGAFSMDITGERTAMPDAGSAAVAEATGEVDEAELERVMALYRGPARRLGSFAITGATVWTVSGETVGDGTVVVRDGRIAAVGPSAEIEVPAGLETIDAAGGHLVPGIIDAHSHIAGEGGLNEGTIAVSSMVSVGDVLNPDDVAIYRALAGGVTTANILHGSSNPIGGQNAVIKLRWGADAEGLVFEGAPPGIKFALGENPKRSNFRGFGIPQRYPQTRMGVMDVIRQAFTEAREYREEWQAWEEAAASHRGRGSRRQGLRTDEPPSPRRDLQLEALVEILEGERLVHSHCYRADEILQLLRLAEEQGFRIRTLQHVLEGYKVADEIAAHGAGASTFSDWWGYKVEAYDAIPYNAALMAERGVLVSINSDSAEEMRHLNQEAAKAVKWGGMDEVAALALVTLNPARQLAIDDRVGSIEVGKDADLVLYDGHPLSVYSVVQKTFVDGDLYFDLEADRERQAAIEAIEAKLSPDEESEEGEADGGEPPGEEGSAPEIYWSERAFSCREVSR